MFSNKLVAPYKHHWDLLAVTALDILHYSVIYGTFKSQHNHCLNHIWFQFINKIEGLNSRSETKSFVHRSANDGNQSLISASLINFK